jgi:hypothetical protein
MRVECVSFYPCKYPILTFQFDSARSHKAGPIKAIAIVFARCRCIGLTNFKVVYRMLSASLLFAFVIRSKPEWEVIKFVSVV